MFAKSIKTVRSRMLKMDEINKIRKAFFTSGESKHKIAKRFNRSWDTVNRIVDASREKLEERGKRPNSLKKVATPEVVQAVDKYLEEEVQKKVKRKQRYRAKIIYKELSQKRDLQRVPKNDAGHH